MSKERSKPGREKRKPKKVKGTDSKASQSVVLTPPERSS